MRKKIFIMTCVMQVLTTWARTGMEVQFHFRVNDDQGKPVRDAKMDMGLVGLVDENNPWQGQKYFGEQGMTDCKGQWSVLGVTLAKPAVSAEKEGYYPSTVHFHLIDGDKTLLRWIPYERQETIVLRRMINPTPMYAWSMHLNEYPVGTNEWAGYDMLRAEWMPPHGKGEAEDVRFHVWRSTNGYDRSQPSQIFTVRFMGEKNGVCGIDDGSVSGQSWLKLPYTAPRDDYSEKEFRVERRLAMYEFETKTNTGTTNCFFRIRSKTDKNGNVIEGLFGKIRGPLEVEGGKKIRIRMVYYVNPAPNDLNMEFDPKRNLIQKPGVVNAVVFP